ncbi:DUF6894 family protein [Belnapia moabensis]|uniref:DUF6894 family protein n=1 Tax=Belnapia moabensis TaxID=365533 RepID=UPI0012EE883B|nr:hypothetical protein [Belnapia moabensis]
MTKFFFHLHDETGVILDPEGEEFSSLDAARMKALELASQLIIDDLKRTGTVRKGYFEIMNDAGHALATVPFLKQHSPELLGSSPSAQVA